MKKIYLFATAILLTTIVIISSCRKTNDLVYSNWVCHCSMTNASGTYVVDIPYTGKTEGDANSQCATDQEAHTSATTIAACQLRTQ